jgi:hypothetical protein
MRHRSGGVWYAWPWFAVCVLVCLCWMART